MSLFAYLDAGSGSIILQAILGGLAGLAVTFRLWKERVKRFFSSLRPGRRDEPAEPEPVDAPR